MTADFIIKRRWYTLFSVILLSIVFSFLAYAYTFTSAKFVWVGKNFYFLVSADTHIQSTAHAARLDGGAGYLFTDGERDYIAYSVYLTEDIGYIAQAGLKENVLLVSKQVEYLVFKGKHKKKSQLYCGAFHTLYSCIEVLSQCISMLENGAIQQRCKRILKVLESQFAYMANLYEKEYSAFSIACKTLYDKLSLITKNVLFCNDLRYLLCVACDVYLQLTEIFSL